MSQTGAIVRRYAGQSIPADYLELVLRNNSKGWGAAIVADGEIMTNKGDTLDVAFIQETVKSFEKTDITFYFADAQSALNEDDLSPYVLLTKDDKPQLVAFVDANLPSFVEAKSSHPAEFFFVNKWLTPKLQDIYDMGELELVMKYVKKEGFKKELMLNVTSRGAITLVAATGETLSFAEGDTSKEFPWGWVSNHYGYGQAPKQTAAPKPEKKTMFPSKSTVREKAPVPASSAVAGAVKAPDTSATAVRNYSTEKVSPPRTLSRAEKKKWYKNRIGYLPDGWADNVAIEVYKSPEGRVMSLAEVKKLGMEAIGLPKLNNPNGVKDTEVDNVPQPAMKPVENKVTTERLPLISPDTREHIKKIMADTSVQKMIAENADIIHDPTKTQKLEAMFAGFATQMGMKSIHGFMSWDYEMMYNLGREKLDGLAVMCWTFRNMLASRMAKEATKAEAGVAAPSEVDPPIQQPVQRRSMFPKKAA